jgi:two-component system sensor histidine kinase YesM
MAREIGELITRDYTNQILMKDAQLKALRMQINPHFLYNTLSTVNWKARMIGADDISVMVQSLSRLLQATLKEEEAGLIPMSEALELVDTYMTIQKFRFEERLAYTRIVPEELRDALIPKLVLQPIVENAVNYGMEQAVGACQIFLTARRSGECLVITIQNDGSCFEDDLLAKLRSGAVAPKGHGTGLANIEKRLELAFGSQARLQLYNLGDMAAAEIRVPCQIS